MMYVCQIIMLYTVNLHSAYVNYISTKQEGKELQTQPPATKMSKWYKQVTHRKGNFKANTHEKLLNISDN